MSQRAFALFCFFLTGTTGLVYQVLWSRFMGGIIGNTHFSITIVVAVFMAGLAIGSYLGGRIADRTARPLRLYGVITVLAGLTCLLVPLLASAGRPLFAYLYQFYIGEPQATPLLTVRIVFCALLLLVPTTFMGATLPALSRYFTRRLDQVGGTLGLLYTINTLGAAFGAAITGFVAIPLLGLWGCTLLGVAIDLVLGALIIAMTRDEERVPVDTAGGTEKDAPATAARLPGPVRLALVAFAISGFANMLLQIAWTKAIVLTIGNSTYAFSLIVTLFIAGIAIGGGAVSLFIDRVRNLPLLLGAVVFVTGALISATIPLLGHFPVLGARWFDQISNPGYATFLRAQIIMVSVVILPATIAMGMVFPIVGKIRTQTVETVGSAVGSAYFWNTLGSILGTLVSGFVLIPLLGKVYSTLYVGAGISVLLGVIVVHQSLAGSGARRVGIAGALLLLVLVPSFIYRPYGVLGSERHFWQPALMSRGAYVYYKGSYYGPDGKPRPQEEFVQSMVDLNQVLLYEEGVHAPVAVVKSGRTGEIAMRISGKVEASLAPGGGYNNDLPHQIMAGHLPMILHPEPRDVLTLGLGGGVTLGTLTLYPEVRTIDSLEISPEVVAAARDYFSSANRGALESDKVRSVIGDGRNHIEYTTQRFDVITSVPSNPWIAGIGNLFTVEFFQACRDRLREGGILCNWIHKINMRGEDFRTVLRTFIEVFGDHAQLWDLGLDCMLIGSTSPVRFDASRFAALIGNAEIARDLESLGVTDAPTFLRHYRLDSSRLRRYVDGGPTNRDNFPILEFSCPYGLYGHDFDAYRDLTSAGRTPLDTTWLAGVDGAILERANVLQEAFHRLEIVRSADDVLAKEIEARRRRGETLASPALLRMALDITDGLKAVEASLRTGNDPWLEHHTNVLAATTLEIGGTTTLAATLARYFLKVAQRAVDNATRISYLEQALSYVDRDPDPDAPRQHAQMWLAVGMPAKAIPIIEAALGKRPENPALLQLLGVLQAASGDLEKGLSLFDRSLSLAKDGKLRSEIHQNRGFALEKMGKRGEAREAYENALAENPENEGARELLDALR